MDGWMDYLMGIYGWWVCLFGYVGWGGRRSFWPAGEPAVRISDLVPGRRAPHQRRARARGTGRQMRQKNKEKGGKGALRRAAQSRPRRRWRFPARERMRLMARFSARRGAPLGADYQCGSARAGRGGRGGAGRGGGGAGRGGRGGATGREQRREGVWGGVSRVQGGGAARVGAAARRGAARRHSARLQGADECGRLGARGASCCERADERTSG